MLETRRYLTQFDAAHTPHILTDLLVIGSGVAGLRAALAASQYCKVLLICKSSLMESNTRYAQGGVASALPQSDRLESHYKDTLRVACGLGHSNAIRTMIHGGPKEIDTLIQWGVKFDHSFGELDYAREGGHSDARVLHANGDATGLELAKVLIQKVKQTSAIRIFENCFAIDLLTLEDRCLGAITFHEKYGHQMIWAKETLLASGGAGRIFRETTNPEIATADGYAMAWRAGAKLRDMEMVQFHPTTLYLAGASRALISEAVRGEGGHLVDKSGNRFMCNYHPQGELAPRDIVSRSMIQHMIETRANTLYLDARHFKSGEFQSRFPGIFHLCQDFGINVEKDLIPVRPSAHYMIGGVVADLAGRTSINGLWACGEVASTGVRGANRLASNSLLEGLVFGAWVGEAAARSVRQNPKYTTPEAIRSEAIVSKQTELDLDDVGHSLRSLLWRNVGVIRSGRTLAETIEIADVWAKYVLDKVLDKRMGWEIQNMLTVAMLMTISASHRIESRGVHYRSDFPETNDRDWRVHLQLKRMEDTYQMTAIPITAENND